MQKEKYKTLHLVLKHKWYDMIASGEKREEYRMISSYWWKRLSVDDSQCPCTFLSDIDASGNKREDLVTFHRGYTKETMTFKIEKIEVGYGRRAWGAPICDPVFVIKLGKRIN